MLYYFEPYPGNGPGSLIYETSAVPDERLVNARKLRKTRPPKRIYRSFQDGGELWLRSRPIPVNETGDYTSSLVRIEISSRSYFLLRPSVGEEPLTTNLIGGTSFLPN